MAGRWVRFYGGGPFDGKDLELDLISPEYTVPEPPKLTVSGWDRGAPSEASTVVGHVYRLERCGDSTFYKYSGLR